MQRLIYDTFDDKVGVTSGINVQMWEHARVRFDVWGFGGQRQYAHIQSSTARDAPFLLCQTHEWSSRTMQPRDHCALSQPD
jgi:hypothetical protein